MPRAPTQTQAGGAPEAALSTSAAAPDASPSSVAFPVRQANAQVEALLKTARERELPPKTGRSARLMTTTSGLVDSVAVPVALRDAVKVGEAVTLLLTDGLTLLDAVRVGETVALLLTDGLTLLDAVKVGETVTLLLAVVEGVTDELLLTDGLTLLDAVKVGETVALLLTVVEGATEELRLTDGLTLADGLALPLADQLVVTVTLAARLAVADSDSDAVRVEVSDTGERVMEAAAVTVGEVGRVGDGEAAALAPAAHAAPLRL